VGRFLETQRMDAIRQVSGMTALFPRCLFNEKQFVIPELRQLSRRTLICTSNMVWNRRTETRLPFNMSLSFHSEFSSVC